MHACWSTRTSSLGSGEGRIDIVDPQGLPLAVDKVGHLCRAFAATDDGVRDEILAGTQRALHDLTEGCGLEAYLNYGALLGAVRDGAMIAHDSDTDVCYLSHAESPADLILESYRIEREMRRRGWTLLRMSGGDIKLLLQLSDGRQCHIDVFVAFRVAGTFYQLGNRSGQLPESAILPLSTIELHGSRSRRRRTRSRCSRSCTARAGGCPTRRSSTPTRSRASVGSTAGCGASAPTWAGGRSSTAGRRPGRSGVAGRRSRRWVDAQVPRRAAVADLGSGTGRDSLFFARRGRDVAAYDFCRNARARIGRQARRRDVPIEPRLLILNELRSVLVAGAELAREGRHLYARQLIGCLDDAARDNLWTLARMAARGRGKLFLEFSAVTRPSRRRRPGAGRPGTARRPGRRTPGDRGGRRAGPPRGARPRRGHARPVRPQRVPDAGDLPSSRPQEEESRMTHLQSRLAVARDRYRRVRRHQLGVRGRLAALEAEVQENRQLHRRVAELTDVVAELLLPVVDRDEERMTELLAAYRARL